MERRRTGDRTVGSNPTPSAIWTVGRVDYCSGLENRPAPDGVSWVRIPDRPPLKPRGNMSEKSLRMLMNRTHNSGNPFQGEERRVLCVCSAGLLRSPTMAAVLAGPPWNYNTRAVGHVEAYALIPLDPVLIAWADLIVVADDHMVEPVWQMAKEAFPHDDDVQIVSLSIPDRYARMAPELVELIKERAGERIPA